MKPIICKARAQALPAGDLPSTCLLLRAGANANFNAETLGQPVPIFTARSAQRVMADAAKRRGTPYSADLEHASLDSKAKATRADACDSMAYFDLAVVSGSLYATNIRWTDEGARRLRSKLNIFVSPVFEFDGESGEVLSFINFALTSNPATFGATQLVAASKRGPAKAAPPRMSVLSAKVPDELRAVLLAAAFNRKTTVSALLRRIVERSRLLGMNAATPPNAGVTFDDLCDLFDLDPKTATADDVREYLEGVLDGLPAGAPASTAPDVPSDPTAAAAPPPKPDPGDVKAARLRMQLAAADPQQIDRYQRTLAGFAKQRQDVSRSRGR